MKLIKIYVYLLTIGFFLMPALAQAKSEDGGTLARPDRRHAFRFNLEPISAGTDSPPLLMQNKIGVWGYGPIMDNSFNVLLTNSAYMGEYPVISQPSSVAIAGYGIAAEYRFLERLRVGYHSLYQNSEKFDASRFYSNGSFMNMTNEALSYKRRRTQLSVDYFHPVLDNLMIGLGLAPEYELTTVSENRTGFSVLPTATGINTGSGKRKYEPVFTALVRAGVEFKPVSFLRIGYYLQRVDRSGKYSHDVSEEYIGYGFTVYNTHEFASYRETGYRHRLDLEWRILRFLRLHTGIRSEQTRTQFSTYHRNWNVLSPGASGYLTVLTVDPLLTGKIARSHNDTLYFQIEFPVEFGRQRTQEPDTDI